MENTATKNFQFTVGFKEAVGFSILLHFIALFYVVDFSDLIDNRTAESKEDESKPIRIKLRKKSAALTKPKQVVNSTKSKNKKRDPKATFLGEHTQSFDRQTVAASTGSFRDAGLGVRNGLMQAQQQKAAPKPKQKKKLVKKARKKIDFSDLSFANHKVTPTPSAPALGLKNGNKASRGLSANNDFIEEVPLGDMTALNTVETKYFGFYNRIRQRLEQYWGDKLNETVASMFKRGRTIASETNHVTALKIKLDSKGNIVEILVKTTSGIRELDDAAIESFSKAGPFPNPPSGMIKNGIATLEWGFVVKG